MVTAFNPSSSAEIRSLAADALERLGVAAIGTDGDVEARSPITGLPYATIPSSLTAEDAAIRAAE
ncbi:MAG: hypothetical protein ACO38D_06985, partial [Ilumatobacteraceae bacterium]